MNVSVISLVHERAHVFQKVANRDASRRFPRLFRTLSSKVQLAVDIKPYPPPGKTQTFNLYHRDQRKHSSKP